MACAAEQMLAEATQNKAFDIRVPLLNTSLTEVFQVGKVITRELFKFFVKVEDFDDRALKSLTFAGAQNVSSINGSKTFELYFIEGVDLATNPIAANAEALRDQAKDACDVTFGAFNDAADKDEYIQNVLGSIPSGCGFSACNETSCEAVLDEEGKVVVEYRNCPCDLVIGLDEEDKFIIYTVSYKGENATDPNNATLVGLFEPLSDAPLAASDFYGIPINEPSTPAIVPRFKTLQDLADRIGGAITEFTGVNTTIIVSYQEGTPGSFVFGITFEKGFSSPPLSFSSSVSLGDFAQLSVVESSLSVDGGFKLSGEFGVSRDLCFVCDSSRLFSQSNQPLPSATCRCCLRRTRQSH